MYDHRRKLNTNDSEIYGKREHNAPFFFALDFLQKVNPLAISFDN